MGRYLFFIIGTVFSGSGVLAVSDVSRNVRTGSSNGNNKLYVYGSSAQNLLAPVEVGESGELKFPEEYFYESPKLEEQEESSTQPKITPRVTGGGTSGGGGASGGWGGGPNVDLGAGAGVGAALGVAITALGRRVSGMENWVSSHNNWANNLSSRVTSIHNWAIGQFNVQNNRWTDQWRKNNDNWGHWKTQWALNNTNKKNWESQWKKNNDNWGHWKTQWKKNNDNWEHWKTQWALNTKQATTNQKFDTFITNQNKKNINFQTQIDNLKKNISWSDAGIIAALVAVKDSIDNFKKMFEVKDLVGLNAHEGIFTRMIKSQFIALRNDLRDLLKSYFGVDVDGANLTPTGVFSKYLGDQIYRLRYTTISEFADLTDFFKSELATLLSSSNTSNTWLNLIYDELKESLLSVRQNQAIIGDWLKLIYDKPTGSVNVSVPPFDFDRLEKILKDLGFDGDGEGGWLKQIIKTVGGIIETAIKTLGDLLGKGIDGIVKIVQKILDILDGLIDTILGLIIPKNWDFLDKEFGGLKGKFEVKFKIFLDLGGLVKNLFKPNKKDFLKALSFTWFGTNFDFTQSQSSLDIYVPKFRLAISVFIWATTAIYIYRKITGTGDVINDS